HPFPSVINISFGPSGNTSSSSSSNPATGTSNGLGSLFVASGSQPLLGTSMSSFTTFSTMNAGSSSSSTSSSATTSSSMIRLSPAAMSSSCMSPCMRCCSCCGGITININITINDPSDPTPPSVGISVVAQEH